MREPVHRECSHGACLTTHCDECEQTSSGNSVLLCVDGDHDLSIIDDSFDHEYGCEQVFYYQCDECGATHQDDGRIPERVDT